MNVTMTGRGNIGDGLADLWGRAGHHVTRLGRDGRDAGAAEAVLLAVPGTAVKAALSSVTGLDRRAVLDATNLYGGARPLAASSSTAWPRPTSSEQALPACRPTQHTEGRT